MDLAAALSEPLTIAPGQAIRVPTGIAVAIPPGYEGQVRPRSGLASESPLIIPNSPGTIDSDYRGEIQVIVRNIGPSPSVIEPGMRIAQLVIARVVRAEWVETDELPLTERGAGGFGHTGTKESTAKDAKGRKEMQSHFLQQ
jgi:dUTP pyrophosphatase